MRLPLIFGGNETGNKDYHRKTWTYEGVHGHEPKDDEDVWQVTQLVVGRNDLQSFV